MQISERQIRELVAEAKEDEVGLWLIVAMVHDELGISEPQSVRVATLKCVQRLLDSGEIVAGYYKPDGSGVAAWNISTASVLAKIDSQWEQLGREPNIGEIVVFIGAGRQ